MKPNQILSLLMEPNGPEKVAKTLASEEILKEVLDLVSSLSFRLDKETEEVAPQIAACLAYLVRVGKQKAPRETMQACKELPLEKLLKASDPKVRKNAVRLVGTLKFVALEKELLDLLQQETVRMVRPSILLSLGALETETSLKALQEYKVPSAADESQEKHVLEEEEALRKALRALQGHVGPGGKERVKHSFTSLSNPFGKSRVELRCERGFEEAVVGEVKQKRAAERVVSVRPGAVLVEDPNAEKLQHLRTVREWLIPLGTVKNADPKSLADKMSGLMEATHAGTFPYYFRLETGKREGTAQLAAQIEKASQGKLLNDPGNYECELRLRTMAKSGTTAVYGKFYTWEDERFSYRKQAISASIHPAGAAGLMQMATPYCKEGASVLDPCCGSGTLLLERNLLPRKKPSALIGMDLSNIALNAAKDNLTQAKELGQMKNVRVKLVHKDMLSYEPKEKVDELYANLPFGNRVGTHKENEILYSGLFEKAASWVKKGGILLLYSMEGKLLLQEAAKHEKELEVLKVARVEAGGLEPTVLILKVK